MELPSSSDYLQTKKRKLIGLNLPNKSSSAYTQNKQSKTLVSEIYFNSQLFVLSQCQVNYSPPVCLDPNPIFRSLTKNPTVVLIESYNESFISGKYDDLVIELTEEHVNELVTKLKQLALSCDISTRDKRAFHKIIHTYIDNLNIIVNYLNLNKLYFHTKSQLNTLQESTALILGNKERLLQYLKDMYYSSGIISLKVDSPLLFIKDEYVQYHRLYGIPEQFQYDLDKMNNIKTKLFE